MKANFEENFSAHKSGKYSKIEQLVKNLYKNLNMIYFLILLNLNLKIFENFLVSY